MAKADQASSSWEERAQFMRRHHAIAAEWDEMDNLRKLQLAPLPAPRPAAPAEDKPSSTKGMVARLMKQHEIQFAHSRFKPPVSLPAENDVPRAVSAKRGTSGGGAKKAQKRAS